MTDKMITLPDPAMTLAQLETWAHDMATRMQELEDTQIAVILTVTATELERRGGNAIAVLRLIGPEAKKARKGMA